MKKVIIAVGALAILFVGYKAYKKSQEAKEVTPSPVTPAEEPTAASSSKDIQAEAEKYALDKCKVHIVDGKVSQAYGFCMSAASDEYIKNNTKTSSADGMNKKSKNANGNVVKGDY